MTSPYEPPKSDLQAEQTAGISVESYLSDKNNHVLGRRWLATLIDYVVLVSFLIIPDAILGNELYRKTIYIWTSLLIMYFPVAEGLTGYSLGKFICRAVVVDQNGNKPSLLKATLRTLPRIIEVNPFLFGGFPAGIIAYNSKTGRRLGDMAGNTYVIASSDLQHFRPKKYN